MLIVGCDDFTSEWYSTEKGVQQRAVDVGPAMHAWLQSQASSPSKYSSTLELLGEPVEPMPSTSCTKPVGVQGSKVSPSASSTVAISELCSRVPSVTAFAQRTLAAIDAAAPEFMTLGQFLVLLAQLDITISRPLASRVFSALSGQDTDGGSLGECAVSAKVPTAIFKHELASLIVTTNGLN
jgi:hypothetical protein